MKFFQNLIIILKVSLSLYLKHQLGTDLQYAYSVEEINITNFFKFSPMRLFSSNMSYFPWTFLVSHSNTEL